MSDLIKRIAAAPSGSRDLNADIYAALGYEVLRTPRKPRGLAWCYRGTGPLGVAGRWRGQLDLTTSTNAAMRLIPEGWPEVAIVSDNSCWRVDLGKPTTDGCYYDEADMAMSYGATPELAICGAALKARGHQ